MKGGSGYLVSTIDHLLMVSHAYIQSPSITPSIKLFMASNKNKNNKNNNNEKVTENSGNFVPPLLRKGDRSFPCALRVREATTLVPKYLIVIRSI